MADYENLIKAQFKYTGTYDFPEVQPITSMRTVNDYISFDACSLIRENHNKLGVTFFIDDPKFERAWNAPDRFADQLKKFGVVLGPDFSKYNDFPLAIQIYNHYRNNWLTRYWQICHNISVIPTVMWGREDTWSWCYEGLPKHSIIATSSVGNLHSFESKDRFLKGWEHMMETLEPVKVLYFTTNFDFKVPGDNVEYLKWTRCKGEVVRKYE